MRFDKKVLSQFMRTNCDLALYMTLFTPREHKQAGRPVPVKARTFAKPLQDAGLELELQVFDRLREAFGSFCLGQRGPERWEHVPLENVLTQIGDHTCVLVQPYLTIDLWRAEVLAELGVSPDDAALIPAFAAIIPDVIVARPVPPDALNRLPDGAEHPIVEIRPGGERREVESGDRRIGLRVLDVKHAADPNASYESEVTFYALVLAAWLARHQMGHQFFVEAPPALWTRGGIRNNALAQAIARRVQDSTELLNAIEVELSPVNTAIYIQSVRRFFAETLPRVIRQGNDDWTNLDWAVDGRCSACDWLGFTPWLSREQREVAERHPTHYCYRRAAEMGHPSQLPLLTRGAQRVMANEGITTVAQIAETTGDEPVYTAHSRLRADRRSIPAYAASLEQGQPDIDSDRRDAGLSRRSDLTVHISVNFDAGSGLLTGLGLGGVFFQLQPYGSPVQQPVRWTHRWVVVTKDGDQERAVLTSFLGELATMYDFVSDPAEDRGGPLARRTTHQLVFWDMRQYEELCNAIGRHLAYFLYQEDEERQRRRRRGRRELIADDVIISHTMRALIWLFPPETLQQRPIDVPPVAFLRDIVRRLVRVPAAHALTLFNVVEYYHFGEQELRLPTSWYREPFSDSIPRERIYEIWALNQGAVRTVRWGTRLVTVDELISNFRRTIDQQIWALENLTRQLRADFRDRLSSKASSIDLPVPGWARGLPPDSKLWLAFTQFENSYDRIRNWMSFVRDAEEIEASYEGIRLTRFLGQHGEEMLWEISPDSLNTKLRLPDAYCCLSPNAFPGFLTLRVRELVDPQRLTENRYGNVFLYSLFRVEALQLEHNPPRTRIAFAALPPELEQTRQEVLQQLGDAFWDGGIVVKGPSSDWAVKRLRDALNAIGNPRIAVPDARTLAALGRVGQQVRPGNDSITPVAQVLWTPGVLREEVVRPELQAQSLATEMCQLHGLNDSQRLAIVQAYTHRLTVIHGPPGTGKTKTAAALLHGLLRECQREGQGYIVLISGPTYKAVDELTFRFLELLNNDPTVSLATYLLRSPSSDYEYRIPDNPRIGLEITTGTVDMKDPAFQGLVDAIDTNRIVVVGTVVHSCPRLAQHMALLRQEQSIDDQDSVLRSVFDFVLLDESSQVEMSKAIFPLALLKTDFQLVIAGDHLQMPPVFQTDPPVGAEHLVGSIQSYMRLRHNLPLEPLLENYRSNTDIVEYIRGLGYPRNLIAANPHTRIRLAVLAETQEQIVRAAQGAWSSAWSKVLDPDQPIVSVTYSDGMSGQANPFEAEMAVALTVALRDTAGRDLDGRPEVARPGIHDDESFWKKGIGVVTPHRAQRAQIVTGLLRAFPETSPELIENAVDTVERFQGGERHTIIISFGVGDPDVIAGEERFLMQLERTNVAVSRAMGKCVLLISEEVAAHIPADRKAIETAHALRGLVDEWCLVRTSAEVERPNGSRHQITVRTRR